MRYTDKLLDGIWTVILLDGLLAAVMFMQGRNGAGLVFTAGTVLLIMLTAAGGKMRDKRDERRAESYGDNT